MFYLNQAILNHDFFFKINFLTYLYPKSLSINSIILRTKTAKTLSKDLITKPFCLANGSFMKKSRIQISQPTDADYLMNELEVTHLTFEQSDISTLARIVKELMSDEITHGIETTEKMLKTGTYLYGYGRLEKNSINNGLMLKKPSTNTSYLFILTKKNRQELIDSIQFDKKALKYALIIFGSIGITVGSYVLYKLYKQAKERKKRENEQKSIREQRLRMERARREENSVTNNSGDSSQTNRHAQDGTTCVLCLQNPREIVLLECGHICLCIDCLGRLQNSSCPICRQNYTSYARCFLP
jgi:E3 ubiquitin-protein ligase MUL1